MAADDVSEILGVRRMEFLRERLAERDRDEAEVPSIVARGRPLPPDLKLLHDHRALSLRLRQTADAVGEPISREEADSDAERMLSAERGTSLAAFRETLTRFAPPGPEPEEER
jgi:hypothetical protein